MLGANEILLNQNFGWDYQFLPEPEGTTACTNLADFVTDVSIPDNSALPAGEGFRKTWRLRNAGTCTWTSEYALVFDRGDQMGGVETTRLTNEVKPDGMIDLSVSLTAPDVPGTYQGYLAAAVSAGGPLWDRGGRRQIVLGPDTDRRSRRAAGPRGAHLAGHLRQRDELAAFRGRPVPV